MFIVSIKKKSYLIPVFLFAALVIAAGVMIAHKPQIDVVINEVCTSNVSCCEDENGDFPDWIEIYNPTPQDIDLSGYIINDSNDLKKEKFVIPDGTILAAGSYYIFDPQFPLSSNSVVINLLDKEKHYIDRVQVPKLKYDTSYGRADDGSPEWNIKEPTPGWSNSDGGDIAPVIEGKVTASKETGFYDYDFELKLRSTGWGRKIYYTTDGTDPRTDGILYEGPIRIYDRSNDANIYSAIPEISHHYMEGDTQLPSFNVDKCTVVRAVAQDYFGRFTDICTYTYFVGFQDRKAYDNLTVVTLSADPDDLYSSDNGIMVLGDKYDKYVADGKPEEYEDVKANFTIRGRKAERAADIEIFDENHVPVLKTVAGMRTKGLSSRWDVQKSFSIFFRKAYGGEYRESFSVEGHDFDYHTLALDKGGQDFATKMKDTIAEDCMRDTSCATTQRIPCCLFLNGEYYGFYWLAERFDASYMAERYGVNKENVEFREVFDLDNLDWWQPEVFDNDALMDYYAMSIIFAHEGDWPAYNFRLWHTKDDEGTEYGDGRWRPVIFDMNSVSMEKPDEQTFAYLEERFYPFKDAVDDDDEESELFREDLVARINGMCAGEFSPQSIQEKIDSLYARIHDQMILDRMRFSNCSEKEAQEFFDSSVEALREFFRQRYGYLEAYKEDFLNGK